MPNLADKLEVRAQTGNTGMTVYDLLEKQRPAIMKALPNVGLTAERLTRILQTQLRLNPKLADCTPASLLGAVMFTAQLGLEPGPLGQAYFVPFMNKKTNKLEVTFIIGYKGLITLAYRSGGIVVRAYAIRERDTFDFNYGTDDVRHTYPLGLDRGEITGFWGKARMPNGAVAVLVMPKEEVDKHRARSKAKDDGAWVTDYEPMGCKTVVRVLAAQLPLSSDAQRAVAADETAVTFSEYDGLIDLGDSPVVVEVEPKQTTTEEGKLV